MGKVDKCTFSTVPNGRAMNALKVRYHLTPVSAVC
jgi:hypothetical protein